MLGLSCASIEDVGERMLAGEPELELQDAGTAALLIGLDVVDDEVVWAAGTGGTYARTVDGGRQWEVGIVPGADSLQFRDVHAVDRETALLLSIGEGESSRIYRTNDGGESWETVFVNGIPAGFFDCFDFWPDGRGVAFSDAVEGRFPLAVTDDARSWMARWGPEAQTNEGGFASSGTCLVMLGDQTVLIGTGNAERARVLRSDDGGANWEAVETPIVGGEGAGIFTLAFSDERRGVAMGGDLTQPDGFTDNAAVTEDGGRTWRAASRPNFAGAVYGAAYVPGTSTVVAVGPNGMSFSHDDAAAWMPADTLSYWSVDFASAASGWAVGPDGRIVKIRFEPDE